MAGAETSGSGTGSEREQHLRQEFLGRLHDEYVRTDKMAARVAAIALEVGLPFDIEDVDPPARQRQGLGAWLLQLTGVRQAPVEPAHVPRPAWFVRERDFRERTPEGTLVDSREKIYLTASGELLSCRPGAAPVRVRRVDDEDALGMRVMDDGKSILGSYPSQQEYSIRGSIGPNGTGYGLIEIHRLAEEKQREDARTAAHGSGQIASGGR